MQQSPIYTQKFLRQRQFFTFLPLIALPFVTFLLWSFGLIGSVEAQGQTGKSAGSFNLSLPSPVPSKDSTWNKLNFYEQADKDAAKLASLLKNDPYYNPPVETDVALADTSISSSGFKTDVTRSRKTESSRRKAHYDPYPTELQGSASKDPNEEKVYQKLAALNQELSKTSERPRRSERFVREAVQTEPSMNTADVDRLESMMQMMQGSEHSGDPQLQQLSGMLDKILAIQHPEKTANELEQKSLQHKQQVFPVSVNQEESVSMLGVQVSDRDTVIQASVTAPAGNAFYSLDEAAASAAQPPASIEAVVHETQTLVSGATVKLRLTTDVYINGVLIPQDEFLFGEASLRGERLEIAVNSIRYGNTILPVDLSVYDMDGMPGIYTPGSITRDVSKQSTQQAIQGLGIASLDPSLGAQAASAGIEAAKSLLTKKTKLVKVTVKAGYQVLLRDNNAPRK